jgi:aminoglycoside 6'-N-acetyltransferase I
MQLLPIHRDQFPLWKELRENVYHSLDDDYHHKEMAQVFVSKDWFCFFLADHHNQILGLVELSSRNIVDGCLSSPVAYLEGLVLKEEFRGKGIGKEAIDLILRWCRRKGFRELATDAELSNSRAQRFYRTLGFQETDRVVKFRTKLEQ